MKIDRKLFENALQIAKKGISKKGNVTSNTLVEIKNDGVSLIGMNDGITVITNMPPNSFVFEETEEKKFLVEPSFMMDLLKQLPKSVSEIEFDPGDDLVLRYEKSEFKLETIEGADMFPLPQKKDVDENFVTIESNDLRRMIRETAFISARKSDSISGGDAMKCLAIQCGKEQIRINAVEAFRFVRCLKVHDNNGSDFKALVFAEDMNEAISAFQNKNIQIYADNKFMYLADDYTFISLRLVNAKEMAIDKILNDTEKMSVTKLKLPKDIILGTIKRACLLSTERKNIGVVLNVDKNMNLLNIQAKSAKGSINEDIELTDIEGNNTEICMNGNLLLDILNMLDCKEVEFKLGANVKTPTIVKNGDEDLITDSTYAIMGINKN